VQRLLSAARRLCHLHQALRARRAQEPLHPTHANATTLSAAFRQHLRAAGMPLLDLSAAHLMAQAAAFGAEVSRLYLTGELVAVAPAFHVGAEALEGERVPLGTLLERATPLYRTHATDSSGRLVALAGAEDIRLPEYVEAAQGLRRVITPSPEWLMTMQLLSHGRPRWWPHRFSERKARDSAPLRQAAPRLADPLSLPTADGTPSATRG
jgi:hypothetical protein